MKSMEMAVKWNRISAVRALVLVLAVALCTGCGYSSNPNAVAPLNAGNLNLIFVVSPDLAYHAPGDINPDTANLTNQGLQRSLLMATYLKQQVLGNKNVNRIYALEPMTHLQTANSYPDMAAIGYIQHFAALNQITLTGLGGYGTPLYTANSYPINASYATGPVPSGVAAPLFPCPSCQGLAFDDTKGSNEVLVAGILKSRVPGFYVFSAPWETISALLAGVNRQPPGHNLDLPTTYSGSNKVYAISITPSGSASLITYNSNLNPPAAYPALPAPVAGAACAAQPAFSMAATGGINAVAIPPGANTNETVYMIRHAEAHPWRGWDDGNFVGAGQWRALALPDALRGKISPTQVYSIDPAQVYPGAYIAGNSSFSYVRPALTAEPYAIANGLPYYLVSEFEIFADSSPQLTSDFFFRGGKFSNQTVLLAWEHTHFPPIITALLGSYFPANMAPTAPAWPSDDYDTIWTVTLDATGNLTMNNALCEGIDSKKLPVTAPKF